mmetsp:Transcript_25284/g.49414  ORF Transcript_25284/g.49414 Transcript_25284/m.49414 type:complete len:203 (+) Transcript_25284:2461-3069(+)
MSLDSEEGDAKIWRAQSHLSIHRSIPHSFGRLNLRGHSAVSSPRRKKEKKKEQGAAACFHADLSNETKRERCLLVLRSCMTKRSRTARGCVEAVVRAREEIYLFIVPSNDLSTNIYLSLKSHPLAENRPPALSNLPLLHLTTKPLSHSSFQGPSINRSIDEWIHPCGCPHGFFYSCTVESNSYAASLFDPPAVSFSPRPSFF